MYEYLPPPPPQLSTLATPPIFLEQKLCLYSLSYVFSTTNLLFSRLVRANVEMFYTCVIKPTLMHGSVVWDNCGNMAKQSVLKLQKRTARIILNADRKSSSITLFNTLNWLPFYRESLIKRSVLVYKGVRPAVLYVAF